LKAARKGALSSAISTLISGGSGLVTVSRWDPHAERYAHGYRRTSTDLGGDIEVPAYFPDSIGPRGRLNAD
jgi:hypothetical protein